MMYLRKTVVRRCRGVVRLSSAGIVSRRAPPVRASSGQASPIHRWYKTALLRHVRINMQYFQKATYYSMEASRSIHILVNALKCTE